MIKELKPICDKWVEPLDIIHMLKSVGINIFPESYSQDFVSICEKVCRFLHISSAKNLYSCQSCKVGVKRHLELILDLQFFFKMSITSSTVYQICRKFQKLAVMPAKHEGIKRTLKY